MKPRYVVLGNGIAGTSAAESLRRAEPGARVTLVTEEPYPLYHRIRLPYLLAATITQPEIFMRSPGDHEQAGIDFLPAVRVTGLAGKARILLTDRNREIPFTKLLIATGGRPALLPGSTPATRVYYCHALDDVRMLLEAMQGGPRSALVVGGSLAGADLAAALALRGMATTWLVRAPRLFHRELDEEGGAVADGHARRAGVDVRYGADPVEVLARDGVATGIRTRAGDVFTADLVACGVGLTRNVEFLRGTEVGVDRGILTDEHLETSVPGIFAAGDVAEFPDPFLGARNLMGTWHNAVSQGELAARNRLGERCAFRKAPFYNNPWFGSRIRFHGKTARHDPDLQSVTRSDRRARHYGRLFFEAGKLVGAAIIGSLKFDARRSLADAVGAGLSMAASVEFLDRWFVNGLRR